MKKVFLLLSVCCAIFAHASTYNFLVFTSTEGTKTAFGVKNLTLKVEGSDLLITNAEGTVNLILAGLASMQFSNENIATDLENVLNADEPVQVFSLSGTSFGVHGSLIEAAQKLGTGTYVISNGSITQTIVLK